MKVTHETNDFPVFFLFSSSFHAELQLKKENDSILHSGNRNECTSVHKNLEFSRFSSRNVPDPPLNYDYSSESRSNRLISWQRTSCSISTAVKTIPGQPRKYTQKTENNESGIRRAQSLLKFEWITTHLDEMRERSVIEA